MKFHILFTGGGTGGHIFPLIAVAQELKKQAEQFGIALDMRYFGADYNYAQEIADNDMEFTPILTTKFRRYWSLGNFMDIFKFPFALIQIFWKIFWFMPEVVFSKGGPGALTVLIASRFYGIPIVIHESDSVAGFTNRISGKWAKKIFLNFASSSGYFKNKNTEIVGNPVRSSLFNQSTPLGAIGGEQAQACRSLGLNPDEPVILILGGSQGATRLNNFILENLDNLTENFQILHQVGEKNYKEYKEEVEFTVKNWGDRQKNRYSFSSFFGREFNEVLAAADIVIARAGAGTISELAVFGKPAILVPLPESANDHQKENARLYAETGAAIVIQQENLLGSLVMEELKKIIQDKALFQKMSESARSFYRPEAAAVIAKYLLTYVR